MSSYTWSVCWTRVSLTASSPSSPFFFKFLFSSCQPLGSSPVTSVILYGRRDFIRCSPGRESSARLLRSVSGNKYKAAKRVCVCGCMRSSIDVYHKTRRNFDEAPFCARECARENEFFFFLLLSPCDVTPSIACFTRRSVAGRLVISFARTFVHLDRRFKLIVMPVSIFTSDSSSSRNIRR